MKKNNFKLIFFSFLFIITLNGCSPIKKELLPTYNKGGYTIKTIKTNSKNNPTNIKIRGKVFDIKSGKTLSNALLIMGCDKNKTSKEGEFTFNTSNINNNLFYIETISIGYKTIQTNFIDLTNKNEVQIDFYLVEDDKPLINCEGK